MTHRSQKATGQAPEVCASLRHHWHRPRGIDVVLLQHQSLIRNVVTNSVSPA